MAKLHRRAKMCRNRLNRGLDIAIFQDGGRRHLGFSKFENVNRWTAKEGRNASPCQIWVKWVKLQLRYGDYSIFRDGG